jgi:hypothetical protein
MEPRRPSALPRRDGEAPPLPSPLDRVQEEEGEGEVACAPLRWRLAGAADYGHPHAWRPPSAGGGELKRYKP